MADLAFGLKEPSLPTEPNGEASDRHKTAGSEPLPFVGVELLHQVRVAQTDQSHTPPVVKLGSKSALGSYSIPSVG